ncbi:MAG: CPBP family glutamic-type intramembrane protease [Patescibacteria group bacterium]
MLPYSLRLLKGSGKPLKMSVPMLFLLSLVQTAVLFAIVIGVGLLAAHAIGLGAPYLEAALAGTGSVASFIGMLEAAIPFGIAAGAILLIADLFFLPYWPKQLVETTQKTTLWENFLASLYGGLNEELLMRLFGLSVVAFLLSRVWHTAAGLPTAAVLWIANVVLAILFGLGHLPALKGLLGKIPRLMIVRSLLLNLPVGLICGWLFWTYGIEAAIIGHFVADIVYHVFGTIVLRRKLRANV